LRLRKDVNVFVYDPSMKFFNVVVELKNEPGALRSVLDILQGLKINILGSFSSVDPKGDTGTWSAFVENSDHTASGLKRRILSSPLVLSAIVTESTDGFLVDSVHFPLTFNTGDRAVLMRSEQLSRMLSVIRKEFGSGGNVILYEEGRAYGKSVGADYLSRLGLKLVESNLPNVMNLYQALGWFKLERVRQNRREKSLTIRVSGCFECEGSKSAVPYSHFVRGHLSGAMTAIFGREMTCEETRCVAAGGQVCEFLIGPTKG
jgi:predicted hydrocarbon binding protein